MSIPMAQLRDLAVRALHTFWQAFLAALGVAWAASGLDVSQVTDLGSAKRFVAAALLAVGAAALSAVKTTLATWRTTAKSLSPQAVAAIYAALEDADTQMQTTPADPDQPAAGVPPSGTGRCRLYPPPHLRTRLPEPSFPGT